MGGAETHAVARVLATNHRAPPVSVAQATSGDDHRPLGGGTNAGRELERQRDSRVCPARVSGGRTAAICSAAFAAMLGVSLESYRTWDAGRRATPPKILARARALATHRDDHALLPLPVLALLIGVHVKTLRAAARVGRLPVTRGRARRIRVRRVRSRLRPEYTRRAVPSSGPVHVLPRDGVHVFAGGARPLDQSSRMSFNVFPADSSSVRAVNAGGLNSALPGDHSSMLSACSSKYSGSVVTRKRSVIPGANRPYS